MPGHCLGEPREQTAAKTTLCKDDHGTGTCACVHSAPAPALRLHTGVINRSGQAEKFAVISAITPSMLGGGLLLYLSVKPY